MKTKYIFVTGGVLSSLGKGVAAASIGNILESYGYTITIVKLDPYLNVDPGTMSPLQHGEVFVTDDGAETDLDLGHYERFTKTVTSQKNNWTAGKIYFNVIEKVGGRYLADDVFGVTDPLDIHCFRHSLLSAQNQMALKALCQGIQLRC